MIRSIFVSLTVLALTACVSTHPGNIAKTTSPTSLVVSTQKNKSISDKYYSFFEYTFENKSDDWASVHVTRLGFENETTEILVNDRLNAWIEGAELKLKKSQYNTAVILGSIAAIGGVVGATSSNGNLQVAGMGALAGASVVDAAQSISRTRNNAASGIKGVNQTVNVPSTYILAPFKVAPGSYIKRWVVIKNPKGGIVTSASPVSTNKVPSRYRKDLWADDEKTTARVGSNLMTEIINNDKTIVYSNQY